MTREETNVGEHGSSLTKENDEVGLSDMKGSEMLCSHTEINGFIHTGTRGPLETRKMQMGSGCYYIIRLREMIIKVWSVNPLR